MDEISPAAAQKINQIVAAADEEHLAAYIKQFMRWLNHAAAVSVPSTPAHRAPSVHRPVPGSTPMHSRAAHQSSPIPPAPLPVQSGRRKNQIIMEEQCVLINHRTFKGPRDCNNASRRLANYHKALDRSHTREEIEGTDEQVKALKGKIKRPVASGKKQEKKEKACPRIFHPGLAPVPAAYAEQAAFLSAPMLSNFVVQLDPALEPSFPPGAGYENLDGNLEDYMYPF
ncbi:hypothetical protein DFH09DRAFT_1068541 [Mycena vulgaris]|nr:hypothetical protein DFH09DRAFT_1068541 [Mycena vulgaris]